MWRVWSCSTKLGSDWSISKKLVQRSYSVKSNNFKWSLGPCYIVKTQNYSRHIIGFIWFIGTLALGCNGYFIEKTYSQWAHGFYDIEGLKRHQWTTSNTWYEPYSPPILHPHRLRLCLVALVTLFSCNTFGNPSSRHVGYWIRYPFVSVMTNLEWPLVSLEHTCQNPTDNEF